MPLHGKVGGSQILTLPGVHKVRCVRVVDIGTHKNKKDGSWLHKIRLALEMPEVKKPNGECFIMWMPFTLSMQPRSGLRLLIESLHSKVFSDYEAGEFDIFKLLGVPAFINIIHNKSYADKSSAIIDSFMPLKDSECPERINDLIAFSLSGFDGKVFGSLPKRIQSRIKESIEYKEIIAMEAADESVSDPDIGIEEDD